MKRTRWLFAVAGVAWACGASAQEPPPPSGAAAVPPYALVPFPRESAPLPGEASLKKVAVAAPPGPAADDLRAWLQSIGASVGEAGEGATEILLSAGADAAALGAEWTEAHPEQLGEEGYLLGVADGRVRVLANGPAGLFYGVQTLRQWAKTSPHDALRGVRIRDYPVERIRGFKGLGPRWQFDEYRAAAEFMARYKMNFLAVCYASYEESFHRFRDPYPASVMDQFHRLSEFCRGRFVKLCVCINPVLGGGNLRYSSDEDYARLRDKCLALVDAGVRWISIALDDIDPDFQYPEDKARFKSFGAAHAYLVNRLRKDLLAKAPDDGIVFCPTPFYGVLDPSTPYYADLRRDLAGDVLLCWTGPDVYSREIKAEQARTQARTLGRLPFVWDNYPITEADPLRKNLGPFTHGAADLPAACCGYMGNSMRQAYLSQFSYVALADYLWNPEPYRPERAVTQAVLHLGGPAAYPALREVVDLYAGLGFPWGDVYDARRDADVLRVAAAAKRLEARGLEIGNAMPDGPLKTEVSQYAIANYQRFARVFLAWGACLRAEREAVEALRKGAPPDGADPLLRDILTKLDAVTREGEALEVLHRKAPPRSTNVFAVDAGEDYIAGYRFWQGAKESAAALRTRVERWLQDPEGRVRLARGWEQDASTLRGGKTWPELEGVYVYAAGSGADVASAVFVVEPPLPAGLVLRLTGKDDDRPEPCAIRVAVNGKTLREGPSGFPGGSWSEKTFAIPASALVAGENRIEVRNLETPGSLGMPPWFGVLRVSVEPATR